MGIFSELRNECLIRELQHELNTDVLLFGFDGNVYFGNLQMVDDCRIATLSPAIEATSTDVEILTPGGEVQFVEFLRVDLWQIVAKGTGIVSDPILVGGAGAAVAGAAAAGAGNREESEDRQESHHLIKILTRLIGDNVAIATLGGFLFEGILNTVRDELAILTVNDVFVPGTSSSISDADVRTVVVNLEAITAVAGTNTSNS